MDQRGKIRVFTGDGKGKTTAALGLALCAVNRGLQVFMVQFLKAPNTSGEHDAAKSLAPLLTIRPMGRQGFIRSSGVGDIDIQLASTALQEARDALINGSYDVVILDEINVAVHLGLISTENLLDCLDKKQRSVELVLTGRNAAPQIIRRADSMHEMKKVKHHYDAGVTSRIGIEY